MSAEGVEQPLHPLVSMRDVKHTFKWQTDNSGVLQYSCYTEQM